MVTLCQGKVFEYDNVSSEELGLYVVHNDGLLEQSFGLNREINTESIRDIPSPYHYSNEDSPLEGTLLLYSEAPWTLKQKRRVSRFLYKNTFKTFISEDNPDIIYNLMFCGESILKTGMGDKGYIEIDYICDSPWAWSKPLITEYYLTLEELKNGFEFEINNISNSNNCISYNAIELMIELPEEATSSPIKSNPSEQKYVIQNLRNQALGNALILQGTIKHPFHSNEQIYINMNEGSVYSNKDLFRSRCINENLIKLDEGVNSMRISADKSVIWDDSNGENENITMKVTLCCQFPIII